MVWRFLSNGYSDLVILGDAKAVSKTSKSLMDFNSLFFGLMICLSLAVFLYAGRYRASEKQRNREDRIDWKVNRFGYFRIIIWIMVSVLAIALLAKMFI